MLINAFPGGNANSKRVELCRFTTSGTFNPAEYPTADGLYDVYIVGGGGGGYGRVSNYSAGGRAYYCGGGGGYAKLISNLKLTSTVAVTIGAAGKGGIDGYNEEDNRTDGGTTKFGNNEAAGGKKGGYSDGGDGGCGGAGRNGSFGGINGADGTGGYWGKGTSGSNVDGNGGKGGGTVDYCPKNPYDGEYYGVGGNGLISVADGLEHSDCSYTHFPPTNYNAGRGDGATANALPGICIVYGIPKY